MDAAAIAARIPLTRGRARDDTAACGLAFDTTGGPLVAVCGLVGGSGASTLALCLARQAASESDAPVLVTEADAHRAGLAVIAGRATPHSLPALARQVAEGQAPEQTFTELAAGLRLIAAAPSRATPADPDQLRALLGQARAAHGLVLVDCGSDWAAAAPILEESTHILWTLPATPTGLARARLLLATDALPRPGRARETLIAIASRPRPDASVRALRRLAAERCERLVLVPHSEQLARGDLTDDDRLRRALTGLAATLRRRP
jgi:Flp pilus assembly CpaE family ATPase